MGQPLAGSLSALTIIIMSAVLSSGCAAVTSLTSPQAVGQMGPALWADCQQHFAAGICSPGGELLTATEPTHLCIMLPPGLVRHTLLRGILAVSSAVGCALLVCLFEHVVTRGVALARQMCRQPLIGDGQHQGVICMHCWVCLQGGRAATANNQLGANWAELSGAQLPSAQCAQQL